MSEDFHRIYMTLACTWTGGYFLLGGIQKIRRPLHWGVALSGLPLPLRATASKVVPGLELCEAGLLFAVPGKLSVLIALFALAVFTIYGISVLSRDLQVPCGCFGGSTPMSWGVVFRNCVWMAVLSPAMTVTSESLSLEVRLLVGLSVVSLMALGAVHAQLRLVKEE